MNKVFKVVFNHITNTWVAVSELTKAHGKKASVSVLPPPPVDNHSQLVAHRSGSLNGFIRFAPLSLALMGVLGSTNLFAAQAYCYIDDTSKAFYCTGGTAAGDSSVSLGDQSKALGKYSISMGYYNTAEGDNSVSIGRASHAVGNSSSTLGYGNNAYSDYSSAVGYSNEASGQYSSALGNQSTASGNYATAIGFKSTASALSSTAIGYQSYAQSRNNTQLTGYSPAGTNNSSDTTGVWKATSAELAVGDPENKGSNGIITRQITGVAAGYKDTDAVNVAQLKEAGTAAQDWVDNQGFAKATDVTSQITAAGTAAQDWVNAQGFAKAADLPCSYDTNGNLSCGKNKNGGVSTGTRDATVLGTGNNESFSDSTTVGDYSVAVGHNNNYSYSEDITVGGGSTAVGYSNNASGKYSSAVGYGNKASDEKSTAMGYNNSATLGSIALGRKNNAEGATTSFVMGGSPTITQNPSLAVGNENNATVGATALGSYNTATGIVYNSSNPPYYTSTSIAPALAVGVGNTATATERNSAIAMGIRNTANANGVVAVGYSNTANGNYSSVFGAESQAIVDFGTAIGYRSYANTLDLKSLDGTGLYAPDNFDTLDDKGKAVWQSTSAALAVGDANGDGNSSGTPITRQITGVAAGSQDTDAVNVAQLKEAVGSGGGGSFSPFTVSGTTGNFKVGSSGSLKMVGSNANLSTNANGGTVTIALADDLNLTSVNTGGVQMSATGLAMSNQKITGLANGTANTDAVNLGQLNTSINTAAAAATTALNTAKSELEGKITAAESSAKGYTDTALGSYAKTSDLAPYAKTADVTSQINSAKTAATTALNNAKTDLQGKIDTANSEIGSLKTDKADKSWVTTELAKVSSGGSIDLSDYATKTYAETQANAAQTAANAYTDGEIGSLKSNMTTAIDTAKSGAITDANAYTDSKVGGLAKSSDLDKKADKSWVTTELAKVSSGGTVDLSDYATKTYAESQANAAQTNANAYTDSKLGGLAKQADLTAVQGEVGSLKTDLGTANADISTLKTDKADKSWVTTELAKVSSGGTVDLSDYATKTYAESQANAAQTNANAYTDSKLGGLAKQADLTAVQGEVGSLKTDLGNKADKTALDGKADKSWVTTELAKVSSGEAIDLSDYAQKDYADNAANTAETNAKGYTDSEMAKAKSYADTAASQAKTDAVADANAYTDTQLGDYAKTTDMTAAINTAKTDAVANANAYTDTALSDNATQTWVNNQKFAKEQAVTDLNSRVDKLVVAGGGYEHITVAGENGSFNVANKETAKFVGDGKNITTDATGGEVKISLADDIAVNSVKVGNNGVALTPNGLNNGGQVISNVAAGVRPTDAVNVGQLHNAMGAAYARMDSMEKHANAGIAQAMASGNMPTIAKPGKGMLAVSGSAYRGESGYAIGYSQMSESGKWLFKATGSGNSRGHYGISAGVGLELW